MLRLRWLGRVTYVDALALQRALVSSSQDHLLLLEHPPTFTLGLRADDSDVLVPAATVGAEVVRTDRGGQVTYHGPGQLVGYPVMTVPTRRGGGLSDTVAWVRSLERLVVDALADLGLPAAVTDARRPGVWVGGAKIAAVGVRLARGRSMHGFALNVDPDLSMFDHIVACGQPDARATSLVAEGVAATMAEVVDAVSAQAEQRWGRLGFDRQDVTDAATGATGAEAVLAAVPAGSPVRLSSRMARAGVGDGMDLATRKPEWLRVPARMGSEFLALKRTVGSLALTTVCEEAGCPNIFECWAEGTATFMINGDRCTRACGFCEVDTRRPVALDPGEPERVAEAVHRLGLDHAVVTAVARDDLADGGADAFVSTVAALRQRVPGCAVELLIPDFRGNAAALGRVFAARPEVLNHNLETIVRLQRAVRPSASYARSLAVLAGAKAAGLITKSGLILGMGETTEEVVSSLADLAAVGVDIVTIGQYLRPSARHLPVHRWVDPEEFNSLARQGRDLGIGHVEASPLTRSSHRAGQSLAVVAHRAPAISSKGT